MDGARLQGLIYKGRGHAADHLGRPCTIYRPQNPTAPFSNQIAQLNVSLNAADQRYLNPNLYGKPVWYADLDGCQTCPGDYIVRVADGKTWFIAAQQQLLPIIAIDCNSLVMVRRQAPAAAFGAEPYSGIIDPSYVLGTEDSPWPASILLGGRALAAIGLPADVKESGWRILLPPSVPLTLMSGDRLDDTSGRSFWVESAEMTDLGWRMTVNEAHA
jgi:hypothetical protein